MFLSQYPCRDIRQPHPHDVLLGRGGGIYNHVGNIHWRHLVTSNKELYVTLPKKQKMLLSKSIVGTVRSQNPPGRFLQKDARTGLWYDVGDQAAQEKTSQALREGAPAIRGKLKESTETADTYNSSSSQQTTESSVPIAQTPPAAFTNGAAPAVESCPIPSTDDSHPPQHTTHNGDDKEESAVDPPTALEPSREFSLGSMILTEAEQTILENGVSIGSAMSDVKPIPQPSSRTTDYAAPVDRGLEPAGLSVGSMMSIGTTGLETIGTSFGSTMSFLRDMTPEQVEGGLEAIGTSFGSMSLTGQQYPAEAFHPPENKTERERVAVMPTLVAQQKSKGSLLECSDTDSEDDETEGNSRQQRSADWEKLKATFESHQSGQLSTSSPGMHQEYLQFPSTNLNRDISQLSTISVDVDTTYYDNYVPTSGARTKDDGDGSFTEMPPPQVPLRKVDYVDLESFEAALLRRGDSLASEDFHESPEYER